MSSRAPSNRSTAGNSARLLGSVIGIVNSRAAPSIANMRKLVAKAGAFQAMMAEKVIVAISAILSKHAGFSMAYVCEESNIRLEFVAQHRVRFWIVVSC